jgi:hypothetical protein
LRTLFLTALLVLPPAHAGAITAYLTGYQVGVDYTTSQDRVEASYELDGSGGPGCVPASADGEAPVRQRCAVQMEAGNSSGYGLFLEQAFRRQGSFYFRPDVGFGLRYLQGELPEPSSGLPLREMSFQLVAFVVKPYVKLGITPAATWPDLFLSLGPTLLVAAGNVSVNGEKTAHALVGASESLVQGFVELEAVLLRFGDGFFSLFTSGDYSGGRRGSKFYPKEKDGMDDFRATFSRKITGDGASFGFGAKLLLNWP